MILSLITARYLRMKPIEPGCLAIIVKARIKENIGKTVRCVQQVSTDYVLTLDNGNEAKMSSKLQQPWLVKAENGFIAIGQFGGIPNSHCIAEEKGLMRIGDDSVQDVLKKVVENVQ